MGRHFTPWEYSVYCPNRHSELFTCSKAPCLLQNYIYDKTLAGDSFSRLKLPPGVYFINLEEAHL
jgi:hypothetical protein